MQNRSERTYLLNEEELSLESIYKDFLRENKDSSVLKDNQKIILDQACDNLDINYDNHTPKQLKQIKTELKQIIYSNGLGLSDLFAEGDALESDVIDDKTNSLDLNIIARNLLRYICRGTLIYGNDERYSRGLELVQKNLEEEKDPLFIAAVRNEMHKIFERLCNKLTDSKDSKSNVDQKQLKIFISNLLAAYPFLDPLENSFISIPQDIEGKGWQKVEYQIGKIDISPKSGALASLLQEQDKIYAYTLTTKNPQASSHLLLMGTTYPTGQGADLSVLYNFYPHHSVGEAHELSLVDKWIKEQKSKIQITGHSKGATMAMIMAARHAGQVSQADCLNPTGLTAATLDRLTPTWNKLTKEQKPIINVYAQLNDPVFPLENGFLLDTNIYKIIPNNHYISKLKSYLPEFIQRRTEAHLHHFAGRSSALILKVNTDSQNKSLKREFRADVKWTVNWGLFAMSYLRLIFSLGALKIVNKCRKDTKKPPKGLIVSGAKKVNGLVWGLITFAIVLVLVIIASTCSGVKIAYKSGRRGLFSSDSQVLTPVNDAIPDAIRTNNANMHDLLDAKPVVVPSVPVPVQTVVSSNDSNDKPILSVAAVGDTRPLIRSMPIL